MPKLTLVHISGRIRQVALFDLGLASSAGLAERHDLVVWSLGKVPAALVVWGWSSHPGEVEIVVGHGILVGIPVHDGW